MTASLTNLEKIEAAVISGAIDGFSDWHDSEKIDHFVELIESLYELIRKVVDYHGGDLFQFTGRSFIIVVKDEKRKKAALKSLEAALELGRKIKDIGLLADKAGQIKIKAGIEYGELYTGRLGSDSNKQPAYLGLPLDIAQRICAIANWEQLMVSQQMAEFCREDYDFEALEPVPVKELGEQLRIFKCTGKRERAPDASSISGRLIQSPMVGREKELEILKTALLELYRGKGQIINISGAPGTGKSRLLAELKKENILDKLYWFEGRGLSNGQHLSYHPFIGIIKSWTGIREEDSALVSEKKLREKILRIYPENPDEVLPFIARFMGLELSGAAAVRISEIDPNALEKLMLRAIRELLVKLSALKPVVIAIEDLHWADQSFLTLLRSLYELSHAHPIVFINVFRPGYEETTGSLVKFIFKTLASCLTSIETVTLDDDSARELISNLLLSGKIPETLAGNIVSRTGGNPFFIEEVLRSLIDRGIISFRGNAFQISDEAGNFEIPENIQKVLHARVENLDEKTRNLLESASVIGRNFYFKLLDEAADTIGAVSERLQYLRNMQFIQETGDKENLEFVFKHALAHQAAYDSLVDNRRKELHLKIAESIEKVFPERISEFYGTLAMHYSKSENFTKAEEYLLKAGDLALSSAAPAEAIEYYKEALKLHLLNSAGHPSQDKLLDLYMKIARSYYALTLNIEALDYFDRVLRSYGLKVSRGKIPTILTALQSILILVYSLNYPGLRFKKKPTVDENRILTIYFYRAKLLSSLNPKKAVFENIAIFKYATRFDLSQSEFGLAIFPMTSAMFGWTGFSMALCRKILEFTARNMETGTGTPWMEYNMFVNLYQFLTGEWKEDKHFRQMYDYCISRGNIWTLLHYVLFHGLQFIETGLPGKTELMINKLAMLGEDYQVNLAMAQHYRLFANYTFRYRKLDENIAKADEGIEYTGKTGHDNILSIILLTKASCLAMKGEIDRAWAVFREGEKRAMERKILKMWYSAIFVTKAYIELEELKSNPSDPYLQKSIVRTVKKAVSASAKVMNDHIVSHQLSGSVHAFLGNYKKALKHFGIAIDLGEKSNGKLELSRTFFETAKCLAKANGKIISFRGKTAKAYLAEARELFSEMGLKYDLRELDRFSR
jgi:class 3 adenylate cyclase/tetratricopeptide (TPR) repeat protein